MTREEAMSENNQRTVWVVNDGGHNYAPAEKYGELKTFTRGSVNPLIVDRLGQDLAKRVGSHVESEEDYLLISGYPILNALALVLWLKRFKVCRLLQWNAKNRDYELTILDRDHLDRQLDDAIIGVV